MKKMLTLFAVILAIGQVAPHAEAKKFGSGKSFGKSYKTSPAQPAAKPVDKKNPTLNAQTPPKKSGLLAGGLFAYLLGSGAFEGLQGMDFLLIVLLALGAVFLFRAIRRGKVETPQPQQATYAGYQLPQSSAPQRQLEQPFEHQGGLDGGVTIGEPPPSAPMVGLAMPPLNGLLVQLDGQRTSLHQGLVVWWPVAELVFRCAHQTFSAAAVQEQSTEVADSSAI